MAVSIRSFTSVTFSHNAPQPRSMSIDRYCWPEIFSMRISSAPCIDRPTRAMASAVVS
jgi:hypothetical protein